MIPPFPNRLTGPAPAGGGTGILLRRAGQGSRRGRTRFGSPSPVAKISLFIPAGLLYNKIWQYGTERACPPCFVLTARRGQGAPGSRPCGRRAQWSRPTSIASAGKAGGHRPSPREYRQHGALRRTVRENRLLFSFDCDTLLKNRGGREPKR